MAKKSSPKAVRPKNSVKASAQVAMAKQLAMVLADTYVLAVKTHGYHWNVTGLSFGGLHALFEAQYNELIAAADLLAERIRALGMMPDGSMEAFLQNSVIREAGPKPIGPKEMVKDLMDSHIQLRDRLAQAEALADDIDDVVTEGMVVARMEAHDKTIWMLRSSLV